MITDTWKVAWLQLRKGIRTPFFFAWTAGTATLVLALNHITFFEFGPNSQVLELFHSTLLLSAAVLGIVTFSELQAELQRASFDLVDLRLPDPLAFQLGVLGGTVLQVGASAATSVLLYAVDSIACGQADALLPICQVWLVAFVQSGVLLSFFLFCAALLPDFWAPLAMLLGFAGGNLSTPVRGPGEGPVTYLVAALFSVVPDLSVDVQIVGGHSRGPLEWLFLGTYVISYIVTMSYASMVLVNWRRRRGLSAR